MVRIETSAASTVKTLLQGLQCAGVPAPAMRVSPLGDG